MTQLVATTLGLCPLPDDAKEALSDLKGHQKEDLVDGSEGEAVADAYRRARETLVADQRAAGLDRIVEGQSRWDDMLAHPLTVHDAVETGGIVRYYDNNNFYRDPVVGGELTADGDVAAELEAAAELTDDLQAVLPGPYTLADLATDEHYGDEERFLEAVGDFLAGEAAAFPDVETLTLLEPSLVANPPADGVDERASAAIDRVAAEVDAEVTVHAPWGAYDEKVHAHLLDADVDALGYDLVSDHEQNLYLINEYGTTDDVALGVVDAQNTRVESADTIAERVSWLEEQTPVAEFDTVYLTPNTGTFYLPYDTFEAKLAALATATDEAAATAEVEA
jgi:5-methyltetrahydropteroyltriglutamate--homocysteine methyltransferase